MNSQYLCIAMKRKWFAGFCLLLHFHVAFSQSRINVALTPADTCNPHRALLVAGTWSGVYAGTLIGLNELWYEDYPHTSFHFFNDNSEWLQMDKAGHVYTGYVESVWTTNALQWAGMKQKKAAWIGAATGFVFQSTLEVFDGFSAEWGASVADVVANGLGSSLSLSQFLLWKEQRIALKFSAHIADYPNDLSARADELFGTSFPERIIKDYNGQTYWLSVNPSSFNRHLNSQFPKWLNIAVGYGVDGLFGGFDNWWTEEGVINDRFDIARVRQFYLSPDIDFTRIRTNSELLKTCFAVLNTIKVPAPALQINSKGKLKMHAVYF